MTNLFKGAKGFWSIVAVAMLALLLVACGGGDSDSSSSAAKPEGKDTSGPVKRVPKLTIGIPQDPGSALNLYVSSGTQFDSLMELVYDKLFAPSPYVDEPQPWLAESAHAIDPFNWEVKIRSGVTWHDGTPFTADDVKFTYEYFRDGPQNRYTHHVTEVPKIDSVDKIDANTLRFKCAYACPSLAKITFADLPIIQKKQWENVKEPAKMTDLPIGTGPYKLVEYKPEQLLRYQVNTGYFGGQPLADEIVVPIIKDATAIFTALRSGEIDISGRPVPPELLQQFSNDKSFKVAHTSALELVELKLNYDVLPFKDPGFRHAVSLAVDRKSIVDIVQLGQARPGLQGYPHPDSPWTKPGLSTPFNAAEAKAQLDKLGYVDKNNDGVREAPDGKALAMDLHVASNQPLFLRAGEMLVKQFADVGLKVTLKSADTAVLAALNRDRAFEMQLGSIGAHGVADPDQFIMSHRSGYLWKSGVAYPEFDALFEQWKAASTVEARKQVSFQMQELFNRQPTSVVLWYNEDQWAYRPSAFDSWVETRGYAIINKWSLLPPDKRGNMVIPRQW